MVQMSSKTTVVLIKPLKLIPTDVSRNPLLAPISALIPPNPH
jgi:hypothetical protein